MTKFLIGLAGLVLAVNGMVFGAWAEETQVAGTSITQKHPSVLDNLTFSYWTNYSGPTLGKICSLQNNPDGSSANGDIGNAQTIDTFLMAGYKLTSDVNIGPVVEFHYRPVLGQDIVMNDSGVRLADSHLYKTKDFNLSADLRLFAPVSAAGRQNDMVTGLEAVQNLTYNVPNTRLTLGYYSFVRGRLYSSVMPGQESFTIYGAPNLIYALSPKVQFTLWNDLVQFKHVPGTGGTMFAMTNAPIDIEPGINWDVTPHLSVNPYLNFFTGYPNVNATYFGMVMLGKLL